MFHVNKIRNRAFVLLLFCFLKEEKVLAFYQVHCYNEGGSILDGASLYSKCEEYFNSTISKI